MTAVRSRKKKLELLDNELRFWKEKMKDDRMAHAGYCEILFLVEHVDKLTITWLRTKFNEANKEVIGTEGTYELHKVNKIRNEFRVKAIARLGKKMKESS